MKTSTYFLTKVLCVAMMTALCASEATPKVRIVKRTPTSGPQDKDTPNLNTTLIVGCGWEDDSQYLPKAFSISNDATVSFMPGNLNYETSTKHWDTGEHQWESIENNTDLVLLGSNVYMINKNNDSDDSQNPNIIIRNRLFQDLFAWGTSGWNSGATCYSPGDYSTNPADYINADLNGKYSNADWGYTLDWNGTVRTLSKDEWDYLINKRKNATNLHMFVSLGCTVYYAENNPEEIVDVYGLLLLPDDFKGEVKGRYHIDKATWLSLERQGAVFLPAARIRKDKIAEAESGYYWTSTNASSTEAYALYFNTNTCEISFRKVAKNYGCAVRLAGDFLKANTFEYRVYNAKDLCDIRDYVNNLDRNMNVNIKLMNDIDLCNISEWIPIGNEKHPYQGTFDGNEHSISNMKITQGQCVGLFGYLTGKSVIKDLTVMGDINITDKNVKYTGGLVGQIVLNNEANTSLSDITSFVNINGNIGNETQAYWGGIVGYISSLDNTSGKMTIERCSNYGKIDISEATATYHEIGGIAGLVSQYSQTDFISCANYGDVSVNDNNNCSGIAGVVESERYIYITNCLNVGKVNNAIAVLLNKATNKNVHALNNFFLDSNSQKGIYTGNIPRTGDENLIANAVNTTSLASGEVAYRLNYNQTLGVDPFPVTAETSRHVYFGYEHGNTSQLIYANHRLHEDTNKDVLMVVTEKATCQYGDRKVSHCSACGKEVSSVETSSRIPDAHLWSEDTTVIVYPTCISIGKVRKKCILCGIEKDFSLEPSYWHVFDCNGKCICDVNCNKTLKTTPVEKIIYTHDYCPNDGCYDITGRKVTRPDRRGLYIHIHDGKAEKIMVK